MSFNTRQENWLAENNPQRWFSRTAPRLLGDFERSFSCISLSLPNMSAARLGLSPSGPPEAAAKVAQTGTTPGGSFYEANTLL